MTECKHEHVERMWFEESYGFLGFTITQCKDCGCRLGSQWYQSDDCGEHWFKMDNGYYDIACKRIEAHKEEINGNQ